MEMLSNCPTLPLRHTAVFKHTIAVRQNTTTDSATTLKEYLL